MTKRKVKVEEKEGNSEGGKWKTESVMVKSESEREGNDEDKK